MCPACRLTYLGYDFLAIHALVKQGAISSVGRQIGVGKESDVFEVGMQHFCVVETGWALQGRGEGGCFWWGSPSVCGDVLSSTIDNHVHQVNLSSIKHVAETGREAAAERNRHIWKAQAPVVSRNFLPGQLSKSAVQGTAVARLGMAKREAYSREVSEQTA